MIPSFDTTKLIGKRFRYKGKYGLSNWTDTVADVEASQGIEFNQPFRISTDPLTIGTQVPLRIIGFRYKLYVRATRSDNVYEFDQCIFLDDEED